MHEHWDQVVGVKDQGLKHPRAAAGVFSYNSVCILSILTLFYVRFY